jgi:predicted DNA-binding transcriptional regulator YafY
MFTADEVDAIAVGARLVRRLRDPGLQVAADRVLEKVAAALPETHRGQVLAAPFFVSDGDAETPRGIDPSDVRLAIRETRKLRIIYADKHGRMVRTAHRFPSLQGRAHRGVRGPEGPVFHRQRQADGAVVRDPIG